MSHFLKPSMPVSRGNAYLGQGKFDKAISDYNDAIRLNPNNAAAYYGRGNAYPANVSSTKQSGTTTRRSASFRTMPLRTSTVVRPTVASVIETRLTLTLRQQSGSRQGNKELTLARRSAGYLRSKHVYENYVGSGVSVYTAAECIGKCLTPRFAADFSLAKRKASFLERCKHSGVWGLPPIRRYRSRGS
jgi:tetratricopeptide (TPR) repeat protein